MINITDKTKCCGCTACYSICPKTAISMVSDEEGFLYPIVNTSLCIGCGICNSVCPIENKQEIKDSKIESYVLRINNKSVLMNSTSGGFITPLAEWVLENNGVLCAATYDEDFKVKHSFIENKNGSYDLSKVRGSKYVQSDLNHSYSGIRDLLKQERLVCFVGTTCQVSGLKSFLRKDHKKLITVDLVCHGTPSPKLWDKYLSYQKSKHNAEICEISFRNKTYGYHSGTMKIRFDNGKVYYGSARVDYMLKSFFKEIASRPICYQCPFKTLNRCSDFTIYDCWHAEELVTGLIDDDKGFTNVMVQSERGKYYLGLIKEKYEIYSVNTERAVALDGNMVKKSAAAHDRRKDFYNNIDEIPMPDLIDKYIPVTFSDIIFERIKIVIYKLGLYRILAKILKSR